jgi:hypothetical protein
VARQVRFRHTAHIEYEMDEDDPTDGVRHSYDYVKRALS